MTRAHRQDRQEWDRQAASGEDRQDRQPDRHLTVATPPAPSSARGGETASPDRQPTHRIVAADRQPGPPAREVASEALSAFRFVHHSPGSLLDQIKYARDGAYSIQIEGWWRNANVWFARLFAAPGLAFCYFVAWAFFTRLPRALIAIPVTALTLMLLNGLPVIHWLVPDWADFTTWWAADETVAVG